MVPMVFCAAGWSQSQTKPPFELKMVKGTWVLASIYKTRNVPGVDRAQAERLLNTRVTYGERSLTACGESIPITGINSRKQSRDFFFDDWRVRFDEVGVRSASITELAINSDQTGSCFGTFSLPGMDVYVKGQDELLVNFGGNFFRAVREK
jgi:hypothetical protein